jgi:hypothetical protein
MSIRSLLGILVILTVSCTSTSKTNRVHNTTHFKFYYTELDDKNIKEIADSLESAYPRITSQLQSGDLPKVNVHFYKDISGIIEVFPGFPKWAVGQATGVSEIHIISPNNPDNDYQTMIRNTKHEFAHCVSIKINPTISNNPRWLWEAVANYEANLPWDPRMLPYMVNHQPPSLQELNVFSNPKIYEVGYYIAQYIAEIHGTDSLKSLIQNNGNLKDSLNMDANEFTKQWYAFVKNKYRME